MKDNDTDSKNIFYKSTDSAHHSENSFTINSSRVQSNASDLIKEEQATGSLEVYGSNKKTVQPRYKAANMNETMPDDANLDMTIMSLNKTNPIGTLGKHHRIRSDLSKVDPYKNVGGGNTTIDD